MKRNYFSLLILIISASLVICGVFADDILDDFTIVAYLILLTDHLFFFI